LHKILLEWFLKAEFLVEGTGIVPISTYTVLLYYLIFKLMYSDNGKDAKCLCGGPTTLFQAKKPTDKRNIGKLTFHKLICNINFIGKWFYKCANENCKYRSNYFKWVDAKRATIWCNCKKPARRFAHNYFSTN